MCTFDGTMVRGSLVGMAGVLGDVGVPLGGSGAERISKTIHEAVHA